MFLKRIIFFDRDRQNLIQFYIVDLSGCRCQSKSDLSHPGMSPAVVMFSKTECFLKSQTKKDKEVKTVQKSDL